MADSLVMEQLFTCFVSSTFKDLQAERQRLVSVLLSNECVPFGMEFFPSAGKTQWPIIVDSIAAADFCVFIIAGRYGSISDTPPLSWTHREFEEATRLGKPIAAVLHGDPDTLAANKCEPHQEGRDALASFRGQVEATTVCKYYRSEADLVEAVTSSIRAFRESGTLNGWVRADSKPVLASEHDFDRVYEFLDIEYSLKPGLIDSEGVDCHYRARRRVVSNDPLGLEYLAIDFTKANDRHIQFSDTSPPHFDVASCTRSDGGLVRLEEPRKRRGSVFVQDVVFKPALGRGETADFEVAGELPNYKFRYRDQIVEASDDGRGAPRTYEWISRRISFPTRRLRMQVFLPDSLSASAHGPLVGFGASSTDPALSRELELSDAYATRSEVVGGEPGIVMTLDIPDPVLLRRYRLAWQLPRRPAASVT